MTYISEFVVNKSIETIANAAAVAFGSESIQRQIEQQQATYEYRNDITNVLSDKQLESQEKGEPFVPNLEVAKERGEQTIRWGVGVRLKGAYACYKAGDELECIRHIILALGSICYALNWEKASAYLNEQNQILFKMKKSEEKKSEEVV